MSNNGPLGKYVKIDRSGEIVKLLSYDNSTVYVEVDSHARQLDRNAVSRLTPKEEAEMNEKQTQVNR